MATRSGIPVVSPSERTRSFDEVVGPVRAQWAVAEARRCLLCNDAPCVAGCPAGVDIPRFIRAIRNQSFRGAVRAIREANCLPGTCARVCPVVGQCEGACSSSKLAEPIAIAALQRFVADDEMRRGAGPDPLPAPALGPVAVVGAGPAGLACAAELVRLGVDVTVFDAAESTGGLLRSGIPRFRLPRSVVDWEVGYIQSQGVRFVLGRRIVRVADLPAEGFEAVFVGVGLGEFPRLGVPGEDLPGVVSWDVFLRDDWFGAVTGRVVVIGGGNSAIDAAAVAVRRGAEEVLVLYRRERAQMPAFAGEVAMAMEDGVRFRFLAAPVAVLGEDRVAALSCVEMRLGPPDGSGRPRPEPVDGSGFGIGCDLVVTALGQAADPGFVSANPGLFDRGRIAMEEGFRTRIPRVWAAGDAVSGGATVVRAVAGGRDAARSIAEHLRPH